jgi:hypothetical protein
MLGKRFDVLIKEVHVIKEEVQNINKNNIFNE